MDTRLIPLAVFSAGCALASAQSIMVSPVQISTPDLVEYDPEFAIGYAINGEGLFTGFISGQTLWHDYNGGEPCLALHEVVSNQSEFYGQADTSNVAHVVMDMGTPGPWEWIAIFNEEWCGFGTDPVQLSFSDLPDGPWMPLCAAELTDWPPSTPYSADMIHLQPPVPARYFRLRGSNSNTSGGPDTYRYAIGEIIFGTVGNATDQFLCTIPCTGSTSSHTPSLRELDFSIRYDPLSHAVHVAGTSPGDEVRCLDMAGRSVATGDAQGTIRLPTGFFGVVLVDVISADGTRRAEAICIHP